MLLARLMISTVIQPAYQGGQGSSFGYHLQRPGNLNKLPPDPGSNCTTRADTRTYGYTLNNALSIALTTDNLSMDEWIQLSRVNRVACNLFSNDRQAADEWGRLAWMKWKLEGIEPEDLAPRRAPGLARRLGRAVKAKHKPFRREMG